MTTQRNHAVVAAVLRDVDEMEGAIAVGRLFALASSLAQELHEATHPLGRTISWRHCVECFDRRNELAALELDLPLVDA